MIYLENNKSDRIDKFDNFLKKYQSGSYLSKSSEKTITEYGISVEVFNDLISNINSHKKFKNSQDYYLLKDLLYELSDKYTIIYNDYTNSNYGIYTSIHSEAYYKRNKYNLYRHRADISFDYNDDEGTVIDIFKVLIKTIEAEHSKNVLKHSETIDKYSQKSSNIDRPGIDYGKYDFHVTKSQNPFNLININSELNIICDLVLEANTPWGELSKISNDIEYIIKNDIIARYFDAIEVYNDFNVKCDLESYGRCKIKISLL